VANASKRFDDVRSAIATRTQRGGRAGDARPSQEEINAIVKRKVAQIRDLGVRAMTLDAARLMGADRDSGSITEGKLADVLAVRGDPLRHMDVLRGPAIVIKRGRRFK
jgi:imidazolonepropionase-like amidohydrolase